MSYCEQCAALLTENRRMRSALHEYACTGTDHPCGCYDQFLSEKAEIERLRQENKWLRTVVAEYATIALAKAETPYDQGGSFGEP